jgi:hypothetical protein
MPEISLGRITPSSISSGSGALKAYLDNGNQVGSLPITPVILIDLVDLNTETVYTFDTDLIIKSITLSSAIATTIIVERLDGEILSSISTSSSLLDTNLVVVTGERLKLSASSAVNVRLSLVKTNVETKL